MLYRYAVNYGALSMLKLGWYLFVSLRLNAGRLSPAELGKHFEELGLRLRTAALAAGAGAVALPVRLWRRRLLLVGPVVVGVQLGFGAAALRFPERKKLYPCGLVGPRFCKGLDPDRVIRRFGFGQNTKIHIKSIRFIINVHGSK